MLNINKILLLVCIPILISAQEISKIGGVATSSISKISGITIGSLSKLNGMTLSGSGDSGGIAVINAETGNTTQFTGVTVIGGLTFSATTGSKNNGTYGFAGTWNGINDTIDAYYNLSNLTDVYARVYVYIPASVAVNTAANNIFLMSLYSGSTILMRIGMGFGSPVTNWTNWQIRGQNVTNTSNTTVARTTGAWHYLEFHWTAGSGSNVISEAWVDGTQVLNEIDNANSAYSATKISIGNIASIGFGADQVLYYDDLKISINPIGAYPSTD